MTEVDPEKFDWSQVDQNEFKQLLLAISSGQDLARFSQGTLLAFIVFMFYLELNPQIGGIFFRPSSDGKRYFNPLGIMPVLKYPFQSINFWKPENWDLNFIIFSLLGGAAFLAAHKLFSRKEED